MMKKIFLLAVMTAAISFTSCGSKSDANVAEEDSLAIDTVATLDQEQTLENVTASLTESLQKGDAAAIKTIIDGVQEQIKLLVDAGDTETANQYVEKIQQFAEANKDKLEQITQSGTTTLEDIMSGVNNLPELAGEKAKAVADSAVNNVKEKAEKKVDETVEKAKAQASEKVNAAIHDATNDAKKQLGL